MSRRRPPKRLEDGITRSGESARPLTDLYAFLLRAPWSSVVGLAAISFLLLNAIFAFLYWIVPESIGQWDGSYLDAFFFSVQTFGSIGYGVLHSQGVWGNSIVVCEAFVSLLSIALMTGVVFGKFARPHARVLFSESMVIETRDGTPTLSFRVANERGNDIVEASIHVTALMAVETAEGQTFQRFFDLQLQRDRSPVFMLSWQVFHSIDEDSPIYGKTVEDLVEEEVRFIVAFSGLDGTFSQTIHTRHMYEADDVRADHRFVDVIERSPEGSVNMDFAKFHHTTRIHAETEEDS